ncbi:M4 family metallopeptidase [Roseibium album]|uniref:M4 family metallopeptidase n=1 Tax=Roseibium album TaxID=311410 RepID=UPI0032995663
MCNHNANPLNCFVPPDLLKRLASSSDPKTRDSALETLQASELTRGMAIVSAMMPAAFKSRATNGGKERLIYDMRGNPSPFALPGTLVRSEGEGATEDPAVDEAYDYSGKTYDFYYEIFNRNSLDDDAMRLISSVHFGQNYSNAAWNGQQMYYGDGDGQIFKRFTTSLDVVAHELTHGVITHTSNLRYENESGALNESFADVMSALVTQWSNGQSVEEADWLMGDELLGPALGDGVRAFRVFDEGKAYEDHPILGTDRQPKHFKDKYIGSEDYGGVHINSGIPNHAFYRVAKALGGNAWETAGAIWYETLLALHQTSDFDHCAETTVTVARARYGIGSREEQAVLDGWRAVGLLEKPSYFSINVAHHELAV